ncbi:GFA family protein [Pseudomonas sp.]|uniref:GFA family protein n=1 Tax=Pseudomonas sp. TaxID=306 RepID=UPI0028A59D5B|nr:GFA family protein [Pseudomonas sp.]
MTDLDTRPVHTGACHCGAVRFSVRLSDGLNSARRCNCSFCRMRGAVAVSAALADLKVEQGESVLTLYQFNTGEAKHWFCSRCGIYTFHLQRSSPDHYGINVACLEGISPFDFERVPVNRGIDHPKDRADGQTQIAGWLHYKPS